MDMDKLPVMLGVENYLEAIQKYYVDKTLLIRDLIATSIGCSVVITRPRRFGKSLALSTLEYFFTNKGDYSYAFQGKKIAQETEICAAYMNQYPVIHLNMKDVYGDDVDEIQSSLVDAISLLARQFSYLLTSDRLLDIEKQELQELIDKKADITLLHSSLRRLSIFLYKHFGKKVVFLIDEYDAPIARLAEQGSHELAIRLLRPLYSNALKGNNCILLSVITGVLHFSKESLFSGLNNPIDASVVDAYLNPYFGFDDEETQAIIDYYGLDVNLETLRRWYGGFNRINGRELFNPWSIMNYALNRRLMPYWVNTGSNIMLRDIVSKADTTRMLDAIENESESLYFVKEINYRNYGSSRNASLSFLVQSGYLTIRSMDANRCVFVFPNEEITSLFENEIIGGEEISLNDVGPQIKHALLSKDADKLQACLEQYILSSLSYYDVLSEKNYQNLVTGLLACLFTEYIVKSEVNVGQGRCDIQISPKHSGGVGMIIEIKNSTAKVAPSKTNMQKMADHALAQIKTQNYIEELKGRHCKRILLYGFAFYRKNVCIAAEEINE